MDCLLLRFRDFLADTVEQHNKIAESSETKKVIWGWWKKKTERYPDPYLSDMQDELRKAPLPIFFVNSDTKKLYKATLFQIYYSTDKTTPHPEHADELCPDYYNDKEFPAWFLISKLEEIKPSELEDYAFSPQNSTFSSKDNSITAILPSRIGQLINTKDFDFLDDNVSLWFICKEDEIKPTFAKKYPSIFYKTYFTRGHYILHLSDLHFGSQHAFAIRKGKGAPVGKQTLLDAICRDLKTQQIDLQDIALVLISGDITCTANSQEFYCATQFIEDMQKRFGISTGQIVCVPGNHDIEWINDNGVIDEDAELNYRLFSQSIYNDKPEDTLIRINEFFIAGKKVAIIGLNSCRLESKENAGIGYVGTEQLQQIDDYVKDNPDVYYKIALIHHHLLPVNYTEQYSRQKREISLLLDSEALTQALISHNIGTVLHGHQHQPYFSKITRLIPSGVAGHEEKVTGTINVIGGGSSGVGQAELNSIGRNTYQLIKMLDDDSKGFHFELTLRVRNSDGAGYITGLKEMF